MRTIILALSAAALPGAAAEQQRFDLVCTYGQTPVRYRVDLQQGVACEAACLRTWTLGAVSAAELTLKDTRGSFPAETPQTITINRQTGELRHWIGGGVRDFIETASCEPASFSGLPAKKF